MGIGEEELSARMIEMWNGHVGNATPGTYACVAGHRVLGSVGWLWLL